MPLVYPQLKEDCLLFIGIHSSYSAKGFRSVLTRLKDLEIEPDRVFKHPNMGDFSIKTSLMIDKFARSRSVP